MRFTRFFNLPALALIAANLIPIFGVIYGGWSLSAILWLYWMESFVVGVFNLPKIALSTGALNRKIRTGLFFIIHYGGFWLAHGFFLFVMLMPIVEENAVMGPKPLNTTFDISLKWALLSLCLSHLISFCLNFIRRDKTIAVTPEAQMFMPYGRVMILHILILSGGYLVAEFGSSIAVLYAFIVMKTIFDLMLHVKFNSLYQSNAD